MQVKVMINGDEFSVLDDTFKYTVLPIWWIPLIASLLGSIAFALFDVVRVDVRRWNRARAKQKNRILLLEGSVKLLSGLLCGALAYFGASTNLLGFGIETTSSRAYVLLGFLFSYVGIDAIVLRFLKQHPDPSGDHDSQPLVAGAKDGNGAS